MNLRRTSVVIIVSLGIIAVWTYSQSPDPIYSVTMTSNLNPDSNQTLVNFNELHATIFNYPISSKLATLFKQLPPRITVSATTSTSNNSEIKTSTQTNTKEMNNLLGIINAQFEKMNSQVKATEINLTSIVDIEQISGTQTSVAQRINMDIKLENYVIANNNDPSHKYIDLNWRSLKVDQPIILQIPANNQSKTTAAMEMDINHLLPMLYSLNSDFKDVLKLDKASSSSSAINDPLMDFTKLSLPMDKWYVLFDPAASLAETAGYKFQGEENGAHAVTIYSLGEGSIREGKHEDSVYNIGFGGDNNYRAELTIPAPNARIDILGYSKMTTNGGDDTAIISQTNEGGSSYAGNFPFVVLGGFGAIMGVVVVIVLLKSRKSPNVHE